MPPAAPPPPIDFKPIVEVREFELPEGEIPFPSGTISVGKGSFAADQVSVTFKKSLSHSLITTLLKSQNIRYLSRYIKAKHYVVKVPPLVNAPLFVQWLRTLPEVEEASLIAMAIGGDTPTNRYYNNYANVNQYGPKIINAEAAWSRTRGLASQSVAVLDSGIDSSNDDFGTGADKIDSTFGIDPDSIGHGTAVASVIGAATTFPDFGLPGTFTIAGMAPYTKVLPITVLDRFNNSSDELIAAAVRKAISQPQVKVINMSLQINEPLPMTKAAVAQARDKNVLIVAIMGNYATSHDADGRPIGGIDQGLVYPGAFWGTSSVSATGPTDFRANFSNQFSPNSVAAPGVDIFTASLTNNSNAGWGFHGYVSGTSFSAPHVAGLAALLNAEFRSMTAFDLKYRMEDTAYDANSSTLPGYDYDIGWGRIDADLATRNNLGFQRVFQPSTNYQLFTIPVWSSQLTADDGGKYDDVYKLFPNANAQVFWHDPVFNQNLWYWDARTPRFGPGRSYWVRVDNSVTSNFLGATAFQKSDHRLPVYLKPGANAIGTPGTSNMLWNPSNVWVSAPDANGVETAGTLADARSRGWVPATGGLFHYNTSTGGWDAVNDYNYIISGEGYYFYSNIECTLLLPKQ